MKPLEESPSKETLDFLANIIQGRLLEYVSIYICKNNNIPLNTNQLQVFSFLIARLTSAVNTGSDSILSKPRIYAESAPLLSLRQADIKPLFDNLL